MTAPLNQIPNAPAAVEVPDEIETVVCGNCLFFRAGPDGNSCRADALV